MIGAYPSLRGGLLIAAGAPLAILLTAFAPGLWALGPAWSASVLLLAVLDSLIAGRARDIRLIVPASSELGQDVQIGVEGALTSQVPIRRAEASIAVASRIVPGGRGFSVLTADRAAGHVRGTIALSPARRGTLVIETLWVRWQGPLGLGWRQERRASGESTAILPDIAAVRAPALQLFIRDAVYGILARPIRGEGSEFEALVEYQPGFDRRAIDWKSSARHSKLLAREYDTERNNQIVFALDSGSDMCEPVAGLPRIDRAVSAALLTSYVALKAGDQVRLFSFAARPERATPFVSGSRNFFRLQSEAAGIDYRFEESNYTLALSTLAAQLQRRSLIVVFTDFTDPTSAELMLESVGRLIDRHLLLFVAMEDEELLGIVDQPPETSESVAQSVAAASLLAQRRLVITRLRHLGVEVIEGRHDEIGTRLMNAYLKIKRRGQL
ncbi:DUF58 domain-containing protein [Sphingomonas sp. 35-24ZXX]|uniref:DUF58 domain-containing protein n=1 Tax=Sphingomonas sp. 35-24ZXX TaxID=1545915 RepID=UPI00053BF388|nr:DUF58 domain-containing protein [Sphingomonas sp. 35-24ZXX]